MDRHKVMDNSTPLISRVHLTVRYTFDTAVPYSLDMDVAHTQGTALPPPWLNALEVRTDVAELTAHIRHGRVPLIGGGDVADFSDVSMAALRHSVAEAHVPEALARPPMATGYFTQLLAWERLQQLKALMATTISQDGRHVVGGAPTVSLSAFLSKVGLERAVADVDVQTDVVFPKRRREQPYSVVPSGPPLSRCPPMFVLTSDGTVVAEAAGYLVLGRGTGEGAGPDEFQPFLDLSPLTDRPKGLSRLHAVLYWDSAKASYVLVPYGCNAVAVDGTVLDVVSGPVTVKTNTHIRISDIDIQVRYGYGR